MWIYSQKAVGESVDREERISMAAVRNCIVALEREKIPIFKDTIVKVLEDFINLDFEPNQILSNCT